MNRILVVLVVLALALPSLASVRAEGIALPESSGSAGAAAFQASNVQSENGTRVEQGVAFLAANGIPPAAYAELATALDTNDHHNVEAVLAKYGYSPEQLKTFITDMNLLLLSNALNPQPSDDFQVRGLTLLQSYGLNGRDMQMLTPLANDPAAIRESLIQKGLSSEQAVQLLEQLVAILQEGETLGLMPYYRINVQLFKFLDAADLPRAILYDSASRLDDPAAAAAYLANLNFTEQQIQTLIEHIPALHEQGVTPDLIEGWTIRSMIYRLEGIGLPPQSIYEVVSLGNIDVVRGYLVAKGLSGDALELALVNVGGCMGNHGETLNPERLRAFQSREARALLDSVGIASTDLSTILTLRRYPASLNTYLAEAHGLDDAQIAAFVTGLSQSTFARTVDPDDADAIELNS